MLDIETAKENNNKIGKGESVFQDCFHHFRALMVCIRWVIALAFLGLALPAGAAQVKIVNSTTATASGSGAAGTPSISSFNIPAGKNRILFIFSAVNTGAETMHNMRIQGATPVFTSFTTDGGLSKLSQGGVATPVSNGSHGEIIGAMGALDPGYSATLTFGIEIE